MDDSPFRGKLRDESQLWENDVWKAERVIRHRPKDGIFLCGYMGPSGDEIRYGIESYFVQEGTGKAIEDAMRGNRKGVVVELMVAPNGKASIKTVMFNKSQKRESP